MKTETKSAPVPNFISPDPKNPTSAKPVAAYRHDGTRRTVGFHQCDNSGAQADNVHLFSATGLFIASVKKAEADALAAKADAANKADLAERKKDNDDEHAERVKQSEMTAEELAAYLKEKAAPGAK